MVNARRHVDFLIVEISTNRFSDVRYLFARICCDLEEYQKAEAVLSDSSEFAKPYQIEDVENLYKPETCSFALQMLGTVHQKSQRCVSASRSSLLNR